MRLFKSIRDLHRNCISIRLLVAGWIAIWAVSFGMVAPSQAQSQFQRLLPDIQKGVADQDYLWTVQKIPPQPYMNEIYWPRSSAETPAFFRDSLVQFVARTYDLTRGNLDGSKAQAWAGGGWLAFRSGLIGDVFGVQVATYTSQPIFAPIDQGGTLLLAPPQNSIGVLGQIYGRLQFGDQEFRGGRQLVDTPLFNAQDNRMVPNTFEAATIVSLPDNERKYDYAAGYVWNVKHRDSNDFIPLSAALAGSDAINRGAPFGMVRYRPTDGLSLVAMDYNVRDFINAGFAQIEYDFKQPVFIPNWSVGANVIDQRSVGANLLTGSPFHTYQASAKAQMIYSGWTLFLAGSMTGSGSRLYTVFGGNPNYTGMQQLLFDNANEKAFGGSVAYDFGSVGLSGLSAGVWYTRGWGAINAINSSTNAAIPDERELDLWIQYRPTEGPLKGFRLKTTYGTVWQQGNVRNSQPELQVVVDYTVLIRPPPLVR